ncbi:hypothetical protein [Streptomyces sp. NPDC029041]|uniref:hypothetical protein n=1 Tax=Streptomyces sp. NPDC029041 TaxID=3155727 RepID=UPI0033D60C41
MAMAWLAGLITSAAESRAAVAAALAAKAYPAVVAAHAAVLAASAFAAVASLRAVTAEAAAFLPSASASAAFFDVQRRTGHAPVRPGVRPETDPELAGVRVLGRRVVGPGGCRVHQSRQYGGCRYQGGAG